MKIQRSPLTITIIELLTTIAVGAGSWIGLHAFLWSRFPYGFGAGDTLPNDVIAGRERFFYALVFPTSFMFALSAVSLIRVIKNQDIRYFSRLSHFALSWPLFSFPLVMIFLIGIFVWVPIGLLLAISSAIKSFSEKQNRLGAVVAIIWNVAWLILAFIYYAGIWNLYGE